MEYNIFNTINVFLLCIAYNFSNCCIVTIDVSTRFVYYNEISTSYLDKCLNA